MDSSSDEMYSATNYMFLKPKRMSFYQLPQVFYCNNLQDRKFVNCHNDNDDNFDGYRWLIFISLLAQKLLLLIAKPLKFLGHTVEFLLNLASDNYSISDLIFNFFQGKELMDKNSKDYLSVVGHLDKRVELESSIKREDPRYNAALSIMASKASYENQAFLRATVQDQWKMELVESGDYWNDYQGKATTQAFILRDKSEDHDTYIVAFRGTEPFDADAWSSDIDLSWLELPNVGKTHAGFMKALGLQKSIVGWPKEIQTNNQNDHKPEAYYAIRDLLKKHLIGNDKAKFILTGHSLGGALAILFSTILIMHEEEFLLERLDGVYTFGQPRVGDETFAKYMTTNLEDNNIKYYRFAYSNDIVPRLPYDDKGTMFKHFGRCLYFNRRYQGQVVQEEPNKNYFSLTSIIPMRVNAFLEIIRSFTIAWKYGSEYEEGWLLRIVRFTGLTFPGLPNHLPQDYVNVTRLGSILSHLD